jgi:hypothetical protein
MKLEYEFTSGLLFLISLELILTSAGVLRFHGGSKIGVMILTSDEP